MKLNPFVRFQVNCPVSAEKARNRLLGVAGIQRLFVPDRGLFDGDGSPRYVGTIKHDRFHLRTRPQLSLRSLLLHLNRQIIIKGRIEPQGGGSLIKIFIRPMTPVLLALPLVTIGLVYIAIRVFNATADLSDWIFLVFFAIWIYSSLHICSSVALSEKEFLRSLFETGPIKGVTDQVASGSSGITV
ncbi:MAG: hypothetical protein JSU74_04820 [Candidatus Zixiibacteriota bacterium]|nr:MAG: hypothetical protein JSU74_04820 [candidate division Zixibacteria bacterium]